MGEEMQKAAGTPALLGGSFLLSLSSLKHGQSPFGVQLLYHLVSVSMFLLNSSSSLFAL
jgi:hypothetical protein